MHDNPSQTDSPEMHFRRWFDSLPVRQRQTLAKLYIVMTSSNNADFTLSDKESLSLFEVNTAMPDFTMRRVARLLTIKAVFSFILSDMRFIRKYFAEHPQGELDGPVPISSYQWQQIADDWKQLCKGKLSDSTLHFWMAET